MRKFLPGMILLIGLVACGGGTASDSTPAAPPVLDPYRTVTPAATLTPLPPLTEVFLPTPTPVTYTVKNGDTLSGIALRYNVSLNDLLAANPGVDANAMPVGTVLIIPVGGVVRGEPTPTPAALTVRQARCWPEASGGLWCFGLVQNEYGTALENLSAQFTLLDSSGNVVASQTAFGLLNILPAGEAMPFAVHFPPSVSASVTPRLQVLTAILLLPGDARYLPVALQNVLVQVDSTGRTAQVTGSAMPTMLDGQANMLWILGTAYDASGNVVGVRRWEAATPVTGGVSLPFSFSVSSVGPAIDRVELLVEARP
ncbi:MAG: hypothetical protein FD146_1197 [Anaerolineaceae bacterium]|nr:MAG: hypothetical protein FD146_1197 [Anaerolineaceae bacterium]